MTERLPTVDGLPSGLVSREQWVCWRAETRDGKATKVPVEPGTDAYASTTDPATWTSFATAREHARAHGLGLGFVFTDEDPLVGVDLDDCRDPDDGVLADWAVTIVRQLDSYTEVSPSGTGLHVLVEGALPDGRNRHGDVELYATARFFTVTGAHLSETPATIEARPEALAAVHAEHVAATDRTDDTPGAAETGPEPASSEPAAAAAGPELDDETLLEKARTAANGATFKRLWRGNTAGYPSHSEADMALCALLAFWTGGDTARIDRLFRQSGLYREKWDEVHFADGATYGERTIERAVAGTDEVYTGGDDPEGWSLEAVLDEAATPPEADRPAREGCVSAATVRELEAELERLEAENERLREELAAARKASEDAPGQAEENDTAGGLFDRLF